MALTGLGAYAAGLLWWGRALLAPAQQAPPRGFATVSALAALGWGAAALLLLGWWLLTGSWAALDDRYDILAAAVAVGFGAQLLFGALSHLIPVVLGGGPSVVRAASSWFERAWLWRVVVVNLGLVLCLLPVPGAVRVVVATLVLAALVAFVPLLLGAVRAAVAARRAVEPGAPTAPGRPRSSGAVPAGGRRPAALPTAQLVAAVASLALAVSVGVAADPAAAGVASSGSWVAARAGRRGATDHDRVRVEARDMSYSPSRITVPAGDRLVVDLVNVDDGSPHDLAVGDVRTERLMPGESASLDVGVVGAATEGWCTVVGHRRMGMVLDGRGRGRRGRGGVRPAVRCRVVRRAGGPDGTRSTRGSGPWTRPCRRSARNAPTT